MSLMTRTQEVVGSLAGNSTETDIVEESLEDIDEKEIVEIVDLSVMKILLATLNRLKNPEKVVEQGVFDNINNKRTSNENELGKYKTKLGKGGSAKRSLNEMTEILQKKALDSNERGQ